MVFVDFDAQISDLLILYYYQLVDFAAEKPNAFMSLVLKTDLVNKHGILTRAFYAKTSMVPSTLSKDYFKLLLQCGDINRLDKFSNTPFQDYLIGNKELFFYEHILDIADFNKASDKVWGSFFQSDYPRTHHQFQLFVEKAKTNKFTKIPLVWDIDYLCHHQENFEQRDILPYLNQMRFPSLCKW